MAGGRWRRSWRLMAGWGAALGGAGGCASCSGCGGSCTAEMLALLPLGGAPDRRGRVGFDAGFDEGRQESSLWKCWLLLRFRGAVSVPETAARRGRGHGAAGRRIERGGWRRGQGGRRAG